MRGKIIFVLAILMISSTIAWDDCPFGRVNDPYPGLCGRYIDTNKDQICDLSKLEFEAQTAPIQPTTRGVRGREYYPIPIMAVLFILYGATFILARVGTISVAAHRRLWNIALLILFPFACIVGVLLAMRISFGLVVPLPFDQLFWHVEAGIAMTIITVFHILWHFDYYKCIFKARNTKVCEAPKKSRKPGK